MIAKKLIINVRIFSSLQDVMPLLSNIPFLYRHSIFFEGRLPIPFACWLFRVYPMFDI